MNFTESLSTECVVPEMRSVEHWPAIVELVDVLFEAGRIPGEARDAILEAFRAREDQCSTGIGGGIAVPHIYSDQVGEVAAVFGRSVEGIEFGAVDNAPVYFVALLIVPEEQYNLHLKTLASIARVLSRAEVRQALKKAANRAEILEALSTESARV